MRLWTLKSLFPDIFYYLQLDWLIKDRYNRVPFVFWEEGENKINKKNKNNNSFEHNICGNQEGLTCQ